MGAISLNSKATEKYAIVASDRMVTLTLPSIEWEQKLPKTIKVTNNCVAATAGSALAFTNVLKIARPQLEGLHDIGDIVETLRKAYADVRNKKLDEDILGKIGLTMQDYYDRNQSLSQQIVAQVVDAMAKYNYNLSILVTGVDDKGAHIYRIDNPGRAEPFDAVGYCAVGSGELHALSTFIANDYDPYLDLNHVAAMTYEAKKRSEKAQGVGEQSDLFIICNNKIVKLPDDMIKKLDVVYLKRLEQEKKAVADIQSEIEKLDIDKGGSEV